MARIGQCYRWSELPGYGHGYLRFEHGRVVCANLKPDLNPDAPRAILVGAGLLREKWARGANPEASGRSSFRLVGIPAASRRRLNFQR